VVKGRILHKLALRGMLFLLIVAGMIWYADPFRLFSPAPYDVTASPVSLVQPGTVVGNTAPEGWTHLILKSRPRVSSGAVSRLSDTEVRYATFLFMTTLARVKAQEGPRTTYVLDDVAIGLGTEIDGKDVVLSPDAQARLEANLGFIFQPSAEKLRAALVAFLQFSQQAGALLRGTRPAHHFAAMQCLTLTSWFLGVPIGAQVRRRNRPATPATCDPGRVSG
jgi:hypothetical protein